ncbi:major facilitator superfamily protein [Mycobacteroides abscessus subsp. abscessus]|uniref:MFS transporter n=1 Tax=Brevibacterium casei TaxID=33889 RepID=UPI00092761FB|nr:MFS transporter [Brevibacterium casei]SII60361.1 major facilitator superfamily protein [Mycobacteroides abscessus subsp. abscessus]
MSLSSDTAPIPSASKEDIRRAGLAGLIGTTIEWYDFYIYGLAAALIFPALFFPNASPTAGVLASFGTFAVGFIARPMGAVIFGHIGDRIGRKTTLMVTLFIMGSATVIIGLLPGYDTLGIWAPTLLVTLRFLQGFAVGGEWGGAVTMVVETSPRHRRGLNGSLPQIGVPAGLVLSSSVFAVVSALPGDAMEEWAWRIPFVLSFALIIVGLFIRSQIKENPTFQAVKESGSRRKLPIAEAFTRHWRDILLCIGLYVAAGVPFYIVTTFVLSYGTDNLGISRDTLLGGLLAAAVVEAVTVPAFGALSDRIGRRPVFCAAALLTVVLAFPFFLMLASGQTVLIWAAMILALALCHAGMYGPTAAMFAELFGPDVRYTGTSVGYQLGGVVAGFLPLVSGALVASAGGAFWPVALIWAGVGAIGLVCVLVMGETLGRDLSAQTPSQSTPSPSTPKSTEPLNR